MSRPKTRLTRQIECVALALGKTKSTIKAWHAQGLDVFDPDQIAEWFRSPNGSATNGCANATAAPRQILKDQPLKAKGGILAGKRPDSGRFPKLGVPTAD